MPALCLFSGVGAAGGADLDEPMSLADVAPTVCAALGLPRPLHCDGVARKGLLSSSKPVRRSRCEPARAAVRYIPRAPSQG